MKQCMERQEGYAKNVKNKLTEICGSRVHKLLGKFSVTGNSIPNHLLLTSSIAENFSLQLLIFLMLLKFQNSTEVGVQGRIYHFEYTFSSIALHPDDLSATVCCNCN